jgi:AcrR family transcriptional regulator
LKRGVVTAQGIQRRQQLIDCAIQLIRDRGLDGFTIANLAKEAKIVLGTMYHYYDSINDVIYDVMRIVNNGYYEQIDYSLSFGSNPKDKLVRFIETNFRNDVYSEEYRMVWLAFWAKVPYDKQLKALSFTMQEHHRSRLADVLTALGVDGEREAYALWIFIDGLWLRGTIGDPTGRHDSYLELAYTYAERMLGFSLRLVKK